MKKSIASTIILSMLLSLIATVTAFALPNDIPDFYYDLAPSFFEVKELKERREPGSIFEVDITTHKIFRKTLKDGYHAFICTPNGEFVTYHELHPGEQLPSDYVYPNLTGEISPTKAPTQTSTPPPTPTPTANVNMTGFSGGDQGLGRLLGDISRGNHPLSGITDSPIIVPRPNGSKYQAITVLDTAGTILNDISGHWAEDSIKRFADKGYIAGYPDGSFRPDAPVSYAEFATIVARFNVQPVRFNGGFEVFRCLNYNSAKDQWYYDAFMIASETGFFGNNLTMNHKIVDEGQQLYQIDDCNKSASREHIALFLANMLSYEIVNSSTSFSDMNDIDTYNNGICKMAIQKMVKYEIINGYPDNTFKPKGAITRAELVTILTRVMGMHGWDMGTLYDNLYGNHQMYFWNEEETLIELVNASRAEKGITPLVRDNNLMALARIKSIDMLVNNYFDHVSPTYGVEAIMAGKFGYTRHPLENLASTYANARVSHAVWEASPGHYSNYMNTDHRFMGCALDFGGSVELFD